VAQNIIDKGADENSSTALQVLNAKSNTQTTFQVFPNPFQNIIKIQTECNQFSFTITDISGKLLMKVIDTSDNTLDLSQLNSGIYFLSLLDLNTRKSQYARIVKQN
jgi:hypothetical protein